MNEELRESYRTLEKRLFREGRIVTPSFISENNMLPFFQPVGLEPFFTLNEPICPRFVVEFYHSLEVKRDEEQRPYIEFKLSQFTFKLTSSQLSRILQTPYALETFYTSKWSLNSLDDHPNSNFFGPKHDLVKKTITTPRTTQTQLLRDSNKLHLDEIRPELRGWELLFRENFFCSIGKRNKVNVCTKMPSEYQQDYKKTRAYAPQIYNDPNMTEELRDIYMDLESSICIYSDAWGLDELEKTLEQIPPYNSRLPAIDDIQNLIHQRTIHEKVDKEGKTIHKLPNQIETNELFDHLRPCELVIRENVYSVIVNRDHTQAIIALMLFCLENGQPFNLAYFIIRRMYFFRDRRDKVLPYGMILTRLFKNLKANMEKHPFDERYKLFPRKMSYLKEKQPKKPPPKRTRNVEKSKRV
ncbi:hypothetical protein Tco_0632321 [Tanacetum coccineum]